ncbi:MAG: hypothetical protein AB1638_09210 [Nitrospirota bacterium]
MIYQLPPPPPPNPPPEKPPPPEPPLIPLPLGAENIADVRLDVTEFIEREKLWGLKVLNPPGDTYHSGGSW